MNVSRVVLRMLFAGVAVAVGAAVGCSSDGDGDADSPAAGGTTAAGGSTSGGESSTSGGTSSTSGGTAGSTSSAGTGAVSTGEPQIPACKEANADCKVGLECCTFSCVNGKCSTEQCTADNATCSNDGQCCGGKCTDSKCVPLNTNCKTSGQGCSGHSECCSKFCNGNVCSATPSFCRQNGDACGNDFECCGGLCTKATGAALGTCSVVPTAGGVGDCVPAGQLCADGASYTGGDLPTCGGTCCSRSCRPFGPSSVLICQPPSGCRPTGELCQTDNDCCGALGSAGSIKLKGDGAEPIGTSSDVHCSKATGATFGRCDNGQACSPGGSICRLESVSCSATDRCCSGTVQQVKTNCQLDSLHIPRCTVKEDRACESGPPPAGTPCASSADCCNIPCVPNPSGSPPFVCGSAACVPTNGDCTTTADCCTGARCIVAPGSTKGKCFATTPPGTGGAGGAGGTGGTGGGGTGGSGTAGAPTVCAEYGQQCSASSPCCGAIPCTGGFCVEPVK